jgi:putative peptidoglycan lipid II flippase
MTTPRRPAGRTGADLGRDPRQAPDWREHSGSHRAAGAHRAPPRGLGWAGPLGDDAITSELARVELSRAETIPFTAITDAAAEPQPAEAAAAAGQADAGILRSSGVMALGTIASRVTGFVRTAILIYALGYSFLSDAYNLANTLPNAVYNLALGGILTSVVVPLIVNAATRDADHGEAYDQRIFTLGVLALAGITVLATAAARLITAVYGHDVGGAATYHLTVIFAYFFIPQIFFYGVSSLAGAILNARGSFAAPMWTPVINNVVVSVVGLAFLILAGPGRTPANITPNEIALLGFGTTLGIILQTVALIPSLLAVGFRWRPRFDFRRAEAGEIGRMGGWMFGYVLTTQVSFAITAIVANDAGAHLDPAHSGEGYTIYSNAWQLFQLPYAIVGISVITAMLPRMSAHAARGRNRMVAADFSGALRLASVIVVPAALVLAVLGAPLARAVFTGGAASAEGARELGVVFAVFSAGLLPYMAFQLLLRVFYALHDSRTPALIGVAAMVVNIVANLAALKLLPAEDVVAALGAGFGLANLTGAVASWYVLSRRLRGLDGYQVTRSLVRMHAAAIPAAVFALAVTVMIGVVIPGGRMNALVTVALAGCGAMFFYVLFARAFELTELTELTSTIRSRLGR